MAVTVKMSGRGFDKLQAEISHIKGGMQKAIQRASRRVATQGRTEISKGIRQNINIKASDLKPQIKVDRHKSGTTITLSETKRPSLKYFDATQNSKGVSYKINKGKGRSFIPGAFIVNSLGGHVFNRQGAKVKMTKGRYQGKMRQRIYKLFGASAWGAFVFKGMYTPTLKNLQQKFENRLQHEINYLITQAKQKSG